MKRAFTVNLPEQLEATTALNIDKQLSDEEAMRLAIELSRLNVEHDTGGPFGTVILDKKTRKVVAVGVNRVVPCNCSLAHGEMTAIGMAQATIGTFDLGADGREYLLFTSAAPCAMCVGGIVWSGVRGVFCAATSEDVEKLVGFDEGPIHPEWADELRKRGIEVVTEFLREEACEVLRAYAEKGGIVYNGRGDDAKKEEEVS